MNLVEKASVEALSNCLATVDAHRAVSRGRRGLCHSAFQAFGHEMDGRARAGPTIRHVVSDDECWYSPRVLAAPAVGQVEGAAAGEHRTDLTHQGPQVPGAGRGDVKCEVRTGIGHVNIARRIPGEDFRDTVVGISDETVERHGHDCNHLGHGPCSSRQRLGSVHV